MSEPLLLLPAPRELALGGERVAIDPAAARVRRDAGLPAQGYPQPALVVFDRCGREAGRFVGRSPGQRPESALMAMLASIDDVAERVVVVQRERRRHHERSENDNHRHDQQHFDQRVTAAKMRIVKST